MANRNDGPEHLRCQTCATTVLDRWRCRCGEPLTFADPPIPEGNAPETADVDARRGLWAFDSFLPVGADPSDRVTLGEGMTPLVDAPGWDARFKLEYVFPTGSFKDRGASATLTRAVELGVDRVVEDSSGNAGAAIATYAARAGLDAEIYVPADVAEGKLRAIRRAGATPVRIPGDRAAVTDACMAAIGGDEGVETGFDSTKSDGNGERSAWYASHAWNPAFFEGTATFAYEVAFARDWVAPDAVVTPLGHGTLFLGAHWGFKRLHRAGWIDELPRLYGAQAAGIAPIVRERRGPKAADPNGRIADAADGIRIANPVRGEEIHEAIRETDGDAVAVTADELNAELDRLHAAGFYTEPTCAVAPAALRRLRERGAIDPDDDVVVPLTGSGLKT
ncbi:threonine synthase [Halorubrum vacuolatum]|uniref:L-threonine synthase n=1 Tax=Halorubrum vacuolatum TaxID=63740 RepID=A0A238X526_HALVU|nr:threonine synthase [Halorubrum vacuolatum]SNR53663.1 L-threonine synthase [Halorubrum vacuolatum]